MFTIEMEEDETSITILDTAGNLEDVQAYLYDDFCYIRQWNEKTKLFDVIQFTPEMYLKLMKAWDQPIGTYQLVDREELIS